MNNESTYLLLIYFTIFIFVKSIIDLIVELNFPVYKNTLDNASFFWKALVKIKDLLNASVIVFILYMLFFVKLNGLIIILLLVCLSTCIEYFLITREYIFLFIENNSNSYKTVKYIDMYFDKIQNLFLFFYTSYLLIKLFAPKH